MPQQRGISAICCGIKEQNGLLSPLTLYIWNLCCNSTAVLYEWRNTMDFQNLKIRNIELAIRYQTDTKSWTARNNTHHVIGISLSGKEHHNLGYQSFIVDDNCVFFLNQRDDYSVYAEEKGACYVIHFTTYEPIETDSFAIKIQNEEQIINLFMKMIKYKSISGETEHEAVSDFYRICSIFDHIRLKKYSPKDTRIQQAKEYINHHFNESDCLKEVYTRCGLSRRRFDELFKAEYLVTPNSYIISQKVKFAKKLLLLQGVNVSEISDLSGFSDVGYFCKVFRKETDMTPSEFRKNHLEEINHSTAK